MFSLRKAAGSQERWSLWELPTSEGNLHSLEFACPQTGTNVGGDDDALDARPGP